MPLINENMILCEVVEKHPELIPVINRFGVRLGLAEYTIKEICYSKEINPDFFLVIINTFLDEEYFPEKKLQGFNIKQTVNYLTQTDSYYLQILLPNVEKHLNAFISLSNSRDKQLELLRRLFLEFKNELTNRIELGGLDDDLVEEMIYELKSILIKHLRGNFNDNLCYAVIFSIISLEKDIQMHNRIRNKILKPLVKLLNDPNFDMLAFEEKQLPKEETGLSNREIDVLKLITLGHINKEVADKLNISLNTVLSHRKNITSKLGIKTISGLTFYAIAHGYINGDDIHLNEN